jgi:hypothetical protein
VINVIASFQHEEIPTSDGCFEAMVHTIRSNQCLSVDEKAKILDDLLKPPAANTTVIVPRGRKKRWGMILPVNGGGHKFERAMLNIEGKLRAISTMVDNFAEKSTESFTVFLCLYNLAPHAMTNGTLTKWRASLEEAGLNLEIVNISEQMHTFKQEFLAKFANAERDRERPMLLEARYLSYFHTIDMFHVIDVQKIDFLLRMDFDAVMFAPFQMDIFNFVQSRAPVDLVFVTLTEEVRPEYMNAMHAFTQQYRSACKLADNGSPLLHVNVSTASDSSAVSANSVFFQPLIDFHIISTSFLRRLDVRHFMQQAASQYILSVNKCSDLWWTDEIILGLAIRLFASPDRLLPWPRIKTIHQKQHKVLISLSDQAVNKVMRTFTRFQLRDEIVEHREDNDLEKWREALNISPMVTALTNDEVIELFRNSIQRCNLFKQ